jgi:hypothetical protein
MRFLLIAVALLSLAGCGPFPGGQFPSLTELQPMVDSVSPEDGSVIAPDAKIEIAFTLPVQEASVDESSLALAIASDSDLDDLIDDIVEGDEAGVEGIYEFSGDGTRVSFRSKERLGEGERYVLVATPGILGRNLLPLNQSPGQAPEPFVGEFIVSGGSRSEGGGYVAGEAAPIERIRPTFVMINEILYDAAGSDTNGDVFVELYGEAGGDITDYELVFVNGEDGIIKDTIELPEDAVIPGDGIFVIADAVTGSPGVSGVEAADYVINFDPQNGPDCVQLISGEGELLDAVGYGEPIVDSAENGMVCYEGSLAPDVASGFSISREFGLDLGDNALDFFAKSEPTPGDL